jgi:alkanesulfonate monooxygenase SsuD/methylene tetrahydromethanopterin reductase-like flavin-dependent oxidoreductase (luciferase family)
MTLTRFGFHFSSMSYEGIDPPGLFGRITAVAQAAESAGFDSIWVPDHAHQNRIGGGPSGPMPEAYSLLAALAAVTSQARLGALVSPVTFRYPALLAKIVATLDMISSGRAILGIGAAWDVAEHAAYGVEFFSTGERQDRLEDAVRTCRALFDAPTVSRNAVFTTLEDAWNVPQPIQQRLPILVGGGGERRTLRTAGWFGDGANTFGTPEVLTHKRAVLDAHIADAGRSPADVAFTGAIMSPESVDQLVDEVGVRLAVDGVDGMIILAGNCPSPEMVTGWGEALTAAFG